VPERSYLLVIGERVALGWVLREQRMAFPPNRAPDARSLSVGDELLLYATRGCFHNPTRDRGRVIAESRVTGEVDEMPEPIVLAGREFTLGCPISVRRLAPLGEGVELAPLVLELDSFASKTGWAMALRRPLLRLTRSDATSLRQRLRAVAGPFEDALPAYVAAARPVAPQRRRSPGE
jgi:hypothetical protein